MKFTFLFIIIFFLSNCSKPKTVLICGDHVCINKAEAEQYFEENLTIEVQIVNKKTNKEIDLVELNLTQNNISEKKISLSSKEKINKELKTLSKDEIIEIKENIKSKKKEKIDKKLINKKNIVKSQSLKKEEIKQIKKNKSSKNIVTRKKILNEKRQIVDVCTIIEKCSIEEISKYLIKQGKKKGYPDITRRQ